MVKTFDSAGPNDRAVQMGQGGFGWIRRTSGRMGGVKEWGQNEYPDQEEGEEKESGQNVLTDKEEGEQSGT